MLCVIDKSVLNISNKYNNVQHSITYTKCIRSKNFYCTALNLYPIIQNITKHMPKGLIYSSLLCGNTASIAGL